MPTNLTDSNAWRDRTSKRAQELLARLTPRFSNREFPLSPPSLSPDERSRLRCLHRNERALFKRRCYLSKRSFVSMYPPNTPFPVLSPEAFFGDNWDALSFGKPYDKEKSFFAQLGELYEVVPRLGIMNSHCENSDYCNYSYQNKNCYLTFGSHYEDTCLYGAYSTRNIQCLDCFWCYGCERSYDLMFSKGCYRCVHLDFSKDCNECLFSRDLSSCRHCIFCANLHQREYCIFNEQKSEEEYTRILGELKINTYSGFSSARATFETKVQSGFPRQAVNQVNCDNCRGSVLVNSRNLEDCYFCSDCEDCLFARQVDNTFDSMDLDYMGYDRSELCYQTIGCLGLFHCISCNACWHGNELYYSQYCFGCSKCFGCVSLRQKSKCILNFQYSEDDFQQLAAHIAGELQSSGAWGEFFPQELSPFAYNLSMAQQNFPLTEESCLSLGFRWTSQDSKEHDGKIISASSLPDAIEELDNGILGVTIESIEGKKLYRLNETELHFYRDLNIPAPRLSPEERQFRQMRRRPNCQLWERRCPKTGALLLSVFPPETEGDIYSVEVFQAEKFR